MAFERLNGTLRRLFGRLMIEAGKSGKSTDAALLVNQDRGNAGLLMDLRVGGSSTFKINKDGYLEIINSSSAVDAFKLTTTDGTFSLNRYGGINAGAYGTWSGEGLNVYSNAGWLNIVNTKLFGESTAVIALRNGNGGSGGVGATPHELRIYGSFASATAYQRLSTKTLREAVTAASGASVTTTISIPKFTHLIGVTTRVTTAIGTGNGTTGYQVGDGTDADLWGAITGTAQGTTSDRRDFTAVDALGPDGADRTITLTAVGGNFDGTGVIEVCAYYLAAEAD